MQNDDIRERIRALWISGRSMKEIAEDITEKTGNILTRSSIAGHISRMGLKRGPYLNSAIDARRKASQARTGRSVPRGSKATPGFIPLPSAAPKPFKTGLLLAELKPSSCRFPFWGHHDHPTMATSQYCGNPIERGNYCMEHYNICYNAVPVRNRR